MRIGVTTVFKGSAFSNSLPQVALYLAKALKDAGHDVSFLTPSESEDWFTDCLDLANLMPRIKLVNGTRIETFNFVIEVVWFLPLEIRKQIGQKIVMFYHHSPVFYDIENSVYPVTTMVRDFNGVDAIWTWSNFVETDYKYLEFISRKPVFKCPFFWNPVLLDSYIKEAAIPSWTLSKKGSGKIIICESNESNTSNCTIPMVILSEIYKKDPTQDWLVLNSEKLITREFFINNIFKNLHIYSRPDLSGNFIKRVRLPDLCREPNYIISHQRWRPIKYMLLDALYLGIPLIHNSELLKDVPGGQWFYNLNRIGQALSCWDRIVQDERPNLQVVRSSLLKCWGPQLGLEAMSNLLKSTIEYVKPVIVVRASIRVAFFDMWAEFQPQYNLFMESFLHNGFVVANDQLDPTIIIFGPFGNENANQKWKHVPKVFYTGENVVPVVREDVVLNIGFSRSNTDKYIRMPNWFLELNWYKNPQSELVKNPLPFTLDLLSKSVDVRSKFCIFVTSNPTSVHRNTLFNTICRYKNIDSAGALFNNCAQIPGGPGGSGGQKSKVEFYRNYKFALVCENSENSGYVTEKLLHAKLAGCVPIYWGDPQVALEFNKDSFINVADYSSLDALLTVIADIDKDSAKWLNIATKPLLDADGISKCKALLTAVATAIAGVKLSTVHSAPSAIVSAASASASASASGPKTNILPYKITPITDVEPRVVVTCCNSKFIDSALRLIKSSSVPVYIWVWDVDFFDVKKLKQAGAKMVIPLDTTWNPQWADFWNPQFYAWKPLVLVLANTVLPKGTMALYLDSGIEIVGSLDSIWANVEPLFVCEMKEHKMKTWSHPTFCSLLNLTAEELDKAQLSANIVGFKCDSSSVAATVFSQTLSNACNPNIISGLKWNKYSDVCLGHRHDQSILSLMCMRNNIVAKSLDDFAGWKSYDDTIKAGVSLYVHRGKWQKEQSEQAQAVAVASISQTVKTETGKTEACTSKPLTNIRESHVVNLLYRKDRLDKFWSNQPYLQGLCKPLVAVNGRDLVLTKEICYLFRQNDFKWKKSVMGCALSHYNLWTSIASSSGSDNILVLEDDALLVPDFASKWNAIASSAPSDADIIFLGGVLPPNKPALPMITEPVNSNFAKVRKNKLFGSDRRYFHFCTYSYIISVAGAKKLCKIIEEKGIFTSADHMLVNHGDDLLNIYFTTPLLAGCVQDNDPIYQNADFNNFNRVDKFDSEIWNNTDTFSNQDIAACSYPPLNVVYFEDEQQKQCIDSEWLAEIFQRNFVWLPASSSASASASGSQVLLYYQHTTPVSVIEGWINRNMDRSIFLLHASDESCKADVSIYKHPGIKAVFRNYWRPECIASNVIHLPLGYLNKKGSSAPVMLSSQRPVTWCFAGAMDRNNRQSVIGTLQKSQPNNKVHLTPTWGSTENLAADKYVDMIRESKCVPCLDGFFNIESYRFYEALEHGAIPIVSTDVNKSYSNILCGCPLIEVADWSSDFMSGISWDSKQNEMGLWWFSFKNGLRKLISDKLGSDKLGSDKLGVSLQ